MPSCSSRAGPSIRFMKSVFLYSCLSTRAREPASSEVLFLKETGMPDDKGMQLSRHPIEMVGHLVSCLIRLARRSRAVDRFMLAESSLRAPILRFSWRICGYLRAKSLRPSSNQSFEENLSKSLCAAVRTRVYPQRSGNWQIQAPPTANSRGLSIPGNFASAGRIRADARTGKGRAIAGK